MYGLLSELAAFTPPAILFDKRTYSPWIDGGSTPFCENTTWKRWSSPVGKQT